jgi:hypothetical protein
LSAIQGEFYAGTRAAETPRFALIDGRRLEVRELLSRKRTFDPMMGRITDIFRCRLEDGRIVDVATPTP